MNLIALIQRNCMSSPLLQRHLDVIWSNVLWLFKKQPPQEVLDDSQHKQTWNFPT